MKTIFDISDTDGTLIDSGYARLESLRRAIISMKESKEHPEMEEKLDKMIKMLEEYNTCDVHDICDLFRPDTLFSKILGVDLEVKSKDYENLHNYEKNGGELKRPEETAELSGESLCLKQIIYDTITGFREDFENGTEAVPFFKETFWIVANLIKQKIDEKAPVKKEISKFTLAWSSNRAANNIFRNSLEVLAKMAPEEYKKIMVKKDKDPESELVGIGTLVSQEDISTFLETVEKPISTMDRSFELFGIKEPLSTIKELKETICKAIDKWEFNTPIVNDNIKSHLKEYVEKYSEVKQSSDKKSEVNKTPKEFIEGLLKKSPLHALAEMNAKKVTMRNSDEYNFYGDSPYFEIPVTAEFSRLLNPWRPDIDHYCFPSTQQASSEDVSKPQSSQEVKEKIIRTAEESLTIFNNNKPDDKRFNKDNIKLLDATPFVVTSTDELKVKQALVRKLRNLDQAAAVKLKATIAEMEKDDPEIGKHISVVIEAMVNKGLLKQDADGRYTPTKKIYTPIIFEDAEHDDIMQLRLQMLQSLIMLTLDKDAQVNMVLVSCGGESKSQYAKTNYIAHKLQDVYIDKFGLDKRFNLIIKEGESSTDLGLRRQGKQAAEAFFAATAENANIDDYMPEKEREVTDTEILELANDTNSYVHLTMQAQTTRNQEELYREIHAILKNRESDHTDYFVTNSLEFNSIIKALGVFTQEGSRVSLATKEVITYPDNKKVTILKVGEDGRPIYKINKINGEEITGDIKAKDYIDNVENAKANFYKSVPYLLVDELGITDPEKLKKIESGDVDEYLNRISDEKFEEHFDIIVETINTHVATYSQMQEDSRVYLHDKRGCEDLTFEGIPFKASVDMDNKLEKNPHLMKNGTVYFGRKKTGEVLRGEQKKRTDDKGLGQDIASGNRIFLLGLHHQTLSDAITEFARKQPGSEHIENLQVLQEQITNNIVKGDTVTAANLYKDALREIDAFEKDNNGAIETLGWRYQNLKICVENHFDNYIIIDATSQIAGEFAVGVDDDSEHVGVNLGISLNGEVVFEATENGKSKAQVVGMMNFFKADLLVVSSLMALEGKLQRMGSRGVKPTITEAEPAQKQPSFLGQLKAVIEEVKTPVEEAETPSNVLLLREVSAVEQNIGAQQFS